MADINPMKYALNSIMSSNILVDDNIIPVLTEGPPRNDLDCIYFIDRPGNPVDNTVVFDVSLPLPEDHPYFNPENPGALYVQKLQRRRDVKSIMDVHIEADKGRNRDKIVNQILKLMDEAVMFSYKHCTNYNKNTMVCSTTGEPCDALTLMNSLGIQGKCPYADVLDSNSINWRNPSTYFDIVNINIFLVTVRGEQNVDDLSMTPEVYHSVLPIEYEVTIIKEVDVNPICSVESINTLEVMNPAKQPENNNRLF